MALVQFGTYAEHLACPHPHADLQCNALGSYAAVVRALLCFLPEAYTSAVQQAPAVPQAVLSVLLDRCLPLLAADCSPDTLADDRHPHMSLACFLFSAVGSACLQSELARRMKQPQGAAVIQQALQVLAALPLQRSPASVEAASFGEQHVGAATLLCQLCTVGSELPTTRLASLARQLVAALPRIATVVAALAADSSIITRLLAQMCFSLCVAVPILHSELPAITSNGQLAAWAAAANAALRLVPALLQLHERFQVLVGHSLPRAAQFLLLQLVATTDGPSMCTAASAAKLRQPAAPDEQLVRQLWALHTSMCRLVAWLAADPSGDRAAMVASGGVPCAALLLQRLSLLRFIVLLEASRCSEAGLLR